MASRCRRDRPWIVTVGLLGLGSGRVCGGSGASPLRRSGGAAGGHSLDSWGPTGHADAGLCRQPQRGDAAHSLWG